MKRNFTPPQWEDRHDEAKDTVMNILHEKEGVTDNVNFELNADGKMSVRMFGNLAMYIYAGKKVTRLEIKEEYYRSIDVLLNTSPEKLVSHWSIIHLESIQSLWFYSNLIDSIYEYERLRSCGELFGCCSRYMACSDALQCVSPYLELQRACSYRTKLLKGIVFYGENRNI